MWHNYSRNFLIEFNITSDGARRQISRLLDATKQPLMNTRSWSRLCKNIGKKSIFGAVRKVDLVERPTSDDCVLGNGFDTLKSSGFPLRFVFLHTLGREPNFKNQIDLPQTGHRNIKRLQHANVS
jgi:hypothetical protein